MTSKKTSTSKTTLGKKKIPPDLIHDRAHQIYFKRMMDGSPGDAESDWLQAENELMSS